MQLAYSKVKESLMPWKNGNTQVWVLDVHTVQKVSLMKRVYDRHMEFLGMKIFRALGSKIGQVPPFGLRTIKRLEQNPWNCSATGTGAMTSITEAPRGL